MSSSSGLQITTHPGAGSSAIEIPVLLQLLFWNCGENSGNCYYSPSVTSSLSAIVLDRTAAGPFVAAGYDLAVCLLRTLLVGLDFVCFRFIHSSVLGKFRWIFCPAPSSAVALLSCIV